MSWSSHQSFPPGAVQSSTPLDPTHCSHPGQLWLSQRAGGLQEVFRPKHEAPGLDRYWWETSGQCTKRQHLPLPPGSGCQCPWAALTWCCHTACCSLVSLQCCPHPEGCHPSQDWGQVAPGNSWAAANPSHHHRPRAAYLTGGCGMRSGREGGHHTALTTPQPPFAAAPQEETFSGAVLAVGAQALASRAAGRPL